MFSGNLTDIEVNPDLNGPIRIPLPVTSSHIKSRNSKVKMSIFVSVCGHGPAQELGLLIRGGESATLCT